MSSRSIGIVGLGYAVGSGIRTNNDPVFDWLRDHKNKIANKNLFTGYKDRAVLENGETLDGIMTLAASNALKQAKMKASDIDLIVGYASISKYLTPNALSEVHRALGMSEHCWILPVQSEYTNYLAGLRIANSMITSGDAKNVLLVCGTNWTRHVDYHQIASISVGDGACAAVISKTSDGTRFSLVDSATLCATKWYGSMDMSPREIVSPETPSVESPFVRLGAYTKPVFNLDPVEGVKAFKEFGMNAPPELALSLIESNDLNPLDVTVISHQASSVLLDAWRKKIRPKQYLDTMAKWGNMTLASMGVTFASKYDEIETNYVVLLGIGVQQETSALLLNRRRK